MRKVKLSKRRPFHDALMRACFFFGTLLPNLCSPTAGINARSVNCLLKYSKSFTVFNRTTPTHISQHHLTPRKRQHSEKKASSVCAVSSSLGFPFCFARTISVPPTEAGRRSWELCFTLTNTIPTVPQAKKELADEDEVWKTVFEKTLGRRTNTRAAQGRRREVDAVGGRVERCTRRRVLSLRFVLSSFLLLEPSSLATILMHGLGDFLRAQVAKGSRHRLRKHTTAAWIAFYGDLFFCCCFVLEKILIRFVNLSATPIEGVGTQQQFGQPNRIEHYTV